MHQPIDAILPFLPDVIDEAKYLYTHSPDATIVKKELMSVV